MVPLIYKSILRYNLDFYSILLTDDAEQEGLTSTGEAELYRNLYGWKSTANRYLYSLVGP